MKVLNNFYNKEIQVLVSTDLGSRGLDFEDVEHVLMYDFALDAINFIHRVGRTGRYGK